MSKSQLIRIASLLILITLFPAIATAQESVDSEAVDTVATLANMIRWTGVAASFVVITAAWLLLRFLTQVTNRLGTAFGEYRLTFHKAAAFIRFAVYFATIVVVVLLSFQISRQVLAILGGTTAVAVGFALKDLVSSVVAGVMIMFDGPFQVGDRLLALVVVVIVGPAGFVIVKLSNHRLCDLTL